MAKIIEGKLIIQMKYTKKCRDFFNWWKYKIKGRALTYKELINIRDKFKKNENKT